MPFEDFHFEVPPWLWGTAALPLVWLLYGLFYRRHGGIRRLADFIDEDLMPHLLLRGKAISRPIWKPLLIWSILWTLLMGAMAGPRWDFKEVEVFKPDQNLVILLDLSQSMNGEDEKPSRIARAKQEVEDILRHARGAKIAVIAFAADPHVINPLTDDMEAIMHLLPSLDTDLVYAQGSRLSPALDLASRMLTQEDGGSSALLVITDGGIEDAAAIAKARQLAAKGIVTHTMGVGSREGAPVKNAGGSFIRKNGNIVISRLNAEKLKEIAEAGGGKYLKANYSGEDSRLVLDQLAASAKAVEEKQHKAHHWEERFYLLLLPAAAILLGWFRRGFVFPIILLALSLPAEQAGAAGVGDHFRNDQQLGKLALERGDYDTAAKEFKDPYRRGVVQYRAGNFAEAEKLFSQASRPEIAENAAYNLGNALARQQKYGEAIKAYESLLDQYPDNEKAKHNLEIVKKLHGQRQQNRDGQDDPGDKNDQSVQNQKDESTADQNPQEGKQRENEPSAQPGKAPQGGGQKGGKDQDAEEAPSFGEEGSAALPRNEREEGGSEELKEIQESAGTEEDREADQWLNRISNDPKSFLKNQFYMESLRRGTKEGSDPW